MIPYTCSKKFNVASTYRSKKHRVVKDTLFANGALTEACRAAIKEMHTRFDVNLDGMLNELEARPLFSMLQSRIVVRLALF